MYVSIKKHSLDKRCDLNNETFSRYLVIVKEATWVMAKKSRHELQHGTGILLLAYWSRR